MNVGPKMIREQESTATVEVPGDVFREAARIADQQKWPLAQAVTYLFSRGIDAQHETERAVTRAYDSFMATSSADEKARLGKELLSAIFGRDSVA